MFQTDIEFKNQESAAWEALPSILRHIHPPSFANAIFLVTDFGARAEVEELCTAAIQAAIAACSAAGGGKVVVPAGVFLSGALYLSSNVNLHLQEGAVLTFSTDPQHYLPLVHTRWEGVELMNYAPMIYAFGEKSIAITGQGTISGRASADNWWQWRGDTYYGWRAGNPSQQDAGSRPRLFSMGEQEVPLAERDFGPGCYLRPNLIQFYNCEQVLIEGIELRDAPMWALHPVQCSNVTIQYISIINYGPSGDGCNPESCQNVLIRHCKFDVSHDGIALKSGRNREGRRLAIPCENVLIQDCSFLSGHGGITIGSETSGGIRKVYAENCNMEGDNLCRAIRIKTSTNRGGAIEQMYFRNIRVKQVSQALIDVKMQYEDIGPHYPRIMQLYFSHLQAEKGGEVAILLEGYPESMIQQVFFRNIAVLTAKQATKLTAVDQLWWQEVRVNGLEIGGKVAE